MKIRAPRNRTLDLTSAERTALAGLLLEETAFFTDDGIRDRIICAELAAVIDRLPESCADLLIIDPPYNRNTDFHGSRFSRMTDTAYLAYVRSWFIPLLRVLKPGGSLYLCGTWREGHILQQVLAEHLVIRNRITWQREKGRGARKNWKNSCEDIWFATRGNNYWFDVEAVKVRRTVRAPYRENGQPKDWTTDAAGRYRLTHPGNLWDDLTVPYWSMPENTDHPAQKPEKLFAKLVLASCPPGGLVLDPFLGSGTAAVVARKLGRRFCGIERNREYCLWALKRLALAETAPAIQGYADGIFWERNSRPL